MDKDATGVKRRENKGCSPQMKFNPTQNSASFRAGAEGDLGIPPDQDGSWMLLSCDKSMVNPSP